jgi:hypothetical protein
MSARAYSDLEYAAAHDLAFDAYCMQHPEQYCRSAKSYVAHLARLCCGLEYGGDPKVYAAIRQSLDGTPALEKPPVPSYRGKMTVADLAVARNGEEHIQLVRQWAQSVWEAYTAQHAMAHSWIRAALGPDGPTKKR